MSLQVSFDTAQGAVVSDISGTRFMPMLASDVGVTVEYSYLDGFKDLQNKTNASIRYCDGLKGESSPLAVYTSFSFPPKTPCESGFTNEVTIYGKGERSLQSREISSVHEMLHAGQWSGSPALHAVHLNARSSLIMSLRDWIKVTLLTEAEAYAKTTLLAYSMASVYQDEAYADATESHPVSVKEIRAVLEEDFSAEDLQKALVDLAIAGMQKTHHDEDGRAVSFAEFYARKAVADYTRSWRLNDDGYKQEFPYSFVRLEKGDYDAMGAAFGPDLMPMLAQRFDAGAFVFGAELEEKISSVERQLGIPAAVSLLSFKSALHTMGVSPDDFIKGSKTASGRAPACSPG